MTTSERGHAERADVAGPDLRADERDRLVSERDFLLASLDDLDTEHAAGEIDAEEYERLHSDYTARAAGAIRALRDGVDARPVSPPKSWRRRALVGACIAVFTVGVGFGLAAALGARLPGGTSSGNTATRDEPSSTADRQAALERAIEADPSDVASRVLLARLLEENGRLAEALAQYDEIIGVDPTSSLAHAHSGRLLYVSAQAVLGTAPAQAAVLVETALARLNRAIDLDAEQPDARFFRAVVRANEYGDFAGAQADLQRYLVLAPEGVYADGARTLLADVTRALDETTSPAR